MEEKTHKNHENFTCHSNNFCVKMNGTNDDIVLRITIIHPFF